MPEALTMETLAAAVAEQSKSLAALTAVTQKHLIDCDKRQKRYNQLQLQTAKQLQAMSEAVFHLEQKFEPFEEVARVATVLTRWGKVIVGTIVLAFLGSITTIIAQNYLDHQAVVRKADIAVQAATATNQTTNQILQKVKTIPSGP